METELPVEAAAPPSPLRRVALALGGLAALALIVVAVTQGEPYLHAFRDWVDTLGFWGPLVFMIGYALAVVGFVPGSVLTLGAGAIFGLVDGAIYVFVAASTGACAAFLIARHGARAGIERRLEAYPRFAAIDRAIAEEGRKIVFLLRLSPMFPFTLLNYALGLTRVSFRDYAIACLGMLPGTVVYVYLGALTQLASQDAGSGLERGLFVVGLIATAAVTWVITRTARRALSQATGESE